MMTYIAIVQSVDGKISKYLDFDKKADAEKHVKIHGGFVFYNNREVPTAHIAVDWENQTASAKAQKQIDDELVQEESDTRSRAAAAEAKRPSRELQRRGLNVLFSLAKKLDPTITVERFMTELENESTNEPITPEMFTDYIARNT